MAAGPAEPGMRIGHAEREAAAADLREHYASGRLTLEELHERLDAALAARTRADLDAVMTDLPPAAPSADAGAGRQHSTRGGTSGGRSAGQRQYADRQYAGTGQAIAAMAWSALMTCALLSLGFLGAFGIGVGRPFGIVLILAGLAFLRRLLFGRRGWVRGPRGPRGRRRCW